jgi:hypothetical protein
VNSQGSPYGLLRRALDNRKLTAALSAAGELGFVGLADALEPLLLILDEDPCRFTRAALRWHGRYCGELKDVDLAEAQAVLACLVGLRGARPKPAAHALAVLVHRRGLEGSSRALMRWADSRAGTRSPASPSGSSSLWAPTNVVRGAG